MVLSRCLTMELDGRISFSSAATTKNPSASSSGNTDTLDWVWAVTIMIAFVSFFGLLLIVVHEVCDITSCCFTCFCQSSEDVEDEGHEMVTDHEEETLGKEQTVVGEETAAASQERGKRRRMSSVERAVTATWV